MELNPNIIRRLSFIKYFYQFAREQSKLPSPQNYISILMFHDSVELFIYLSAQFRDINIKTKTNFMEYWQKFVDDGFELSHKADMNKLNEARKNFKHSGNFPNKDDIEFFRVITKSFFEENCPLIFGLEFSEISLLDLIQDDGVKEILRNAQNESDGGEYKKSLELIALAFKTLLKNYEENKKISYKSLFDIGENLRFLSPFSLFYGNNDPVKYSDYIRQITETINDIQEILKILVLNLDSKKYIKFRYLTPIINFGSNEIHFTTWTKGSSKGENSEDIKFCMDYVIESALNLQKFDFEVDNIRR